MRGGIWSAKNMHHKLVKNLATKSLMVWGWVCLGVKQSSHVIQHLWCSMKHKNKKIILFVKIWNEAKERIFHFLSTNLDKNVFFNLSCQIHLHKNCRSHYYHFNKNKKLQKLQIFWTNKNCFPQVSKPVGEGLLIWQH